MLKHLVVLSALAIGSASVAHADAVSGYFSAAGGTDTFTSNTLQFTPNTAVVGGAVGGAFASYLTDGNPINFLSGSLPYTQGAHTTPGMVPIQLFTSSEGGETFAFNLTAYNAAYVTDGTSGCTSGSTCLIITGDGFFTGTGAVNFMQSPASFLFTSQYVTGQPVNTVTTFSASASATPSAVPEPASLALFGTGLLGVVGFARRKFNV